MAEYNYTGNVQTVTLQPGKYAIECYGASGGNGNGNTEAYAGLGGYTFGIIDLLTPQIFYIYVGGAGSWANNSVGGWNGGGSANNQNSAAGSGGGATDIRLTSGAWNNTASLRSRIMVAGGGGGGARYTAKGGDGGGLTGGSGDGATGGTQTSGGTSGGSFGIGGNGPNTNYGKGCGGGGYYGGGTNASGNTYYLSGGGGSSFISGLTGCNAVNINGVHTGQPIHYSGLFFTDCINLQGVNRGHGKVTITSINIDDTLKAGEVKRFNYTGTMQAIKLRPGIYDLECYGASGGVGYGNGNPYGQGGYISGRLTLKEVTTLYVYVGQCGVSNAYTTTRFNGGGAANGSNAHSGGAGGGATDFRLSPGSWNSVESLKSRILVAGGGGGGKPTCGGTGTSAGHGGNFTGGQSYASGGYAGSYSNGGSQTAGGTSYSPYGGETFTGSFGAGADSAGCGAGGGGGWYGGGSGYTSGGGGGSSYAAGWPGCNTTYRAQQNYTTLTEVKYSQGINDGNGYAIITCIEAGQIINAIKGTGVEKIENEEGKVQFTAEEGSLVTLIATLLPGYKDGYWTGDYNEDSETITFTMPNTDVNIIAEGIPRDDILYTVKHHLINLDETYTLKDVIELEGTTDTEVIPPTIEYTGFVAPELQSANVNGDGSTVIDYYYTRGLFNLTVLNGVSKKYEYLFEEIGNLQYDKMDDATYTFDFWDSEHEIEIDNIRSRQTTFKMPPYDITVFVIGKLNRLNTNIYKNIFPVSVLDMDIINNALDNVETTNSDINQQNHGFEVGDVLYCDTNGKYHKALAEDSEKAFPVGVVSGISSDNVFTITRTGLMNTDIKYTYTDTSVLYLSDRYPGKLVHYQAISNDIYIPVAMYTNQGLLVNIQQGSKGAKMLPYGELIQNNDFEQYTEEELNEVIDTVKGGVL